MERKTHFHFQILDELKIIKGLSDEMYVELGMKMQS